MFEGKGPVDGSPHGSDSRTRLSRQRIVEAAIECIDMFGLSALTMRRLGGHLGVEAMSLYRYVTGRDDLIEAVVDHLMVTMRPSGLPGESAGTAVERAGPAPDSPAAGWRPYLERFIRSVRTVLLQHPSLFPLLMTPNPAAPWLCPPLRSLRVADELLGCLAVEGCTARQAVYAYRMASAFLLGFLSLEVGGLVLVGGSGARSGAAPTVVDAAQFPNLAATRNAWDDFDLDSEFEVSLHQTLDLIEDLLGA